MFKRVVVRYLDSEFIGHLKASDLLNIFNEILQEFDINKDLH